MAWRVVTTRPPAADSHRVHAIVPEPEFVLKATPPRLPRAALRREPLMQRWQEIRHRPLLLVEAPDGSGKSTLLLHWRRNWLEHGALVAWCTADARDDRARFLKALAHALQHAAGRSRSESLAARHAPKPDWHSEGFTDLLAAMARVRGELVLMIDDCERLPAATVRDALAYLIHNAPANLRIVLTSNAPLPWAPESIPVDLALRLGAEDLRLRLEDSLAILARRASDRIDADDGQRLHRASEGWAMGLQLAAAAIEQGPPSPRVVESVVWLRGPLTTRFLDALLARMPGELLEFLTQISLLDHMNGELCQAMTRNPAAIAMLARAILDTPLLIVGQTKDWCCLHPLARQVLLQRAARLPVGERRDLHRRASAWYVHAGRLHDAAAHAEEAGDFVAARGLRARLLWQLVAQGRLPEAREYLARLPPADGERDRDLRLIAAWLAACSERNGVGLAEARQLLADPELDPQRRFVAALVAASAAGYGDRIGLIPDLLAPWPEGSAIIEDSGYSAIYANGLAIVALHRGHVSALRDIQARGQGTGHRHPSSLGQAIGKVLVGLSHLWEGYPDRAEAVLRQALAQAEQSEGRRSAVASMFAAVTAAALLQRHQTSGALALLAGRLDVIESTALPDAVLCARQTLACAAMDCGDEAQALAILAGLRETAIARQQPRLQLHALGDAIRIHALAGRIDQARALEVELDALSGMFARADFHCQRPQYDLLSAIAKAHVCLAGDDLGTADRHLLAADAIARELGRGRDLLLVQVLRAVVARRREAPLALRLLGEALMMAKLGGNRRLLLDSHPLATEMAHALRKSSAAGRRTLRRGGIGEASESGRVQTNIGSASLLTPIEARALDGRCRGMTAAAIAGELAVSPELVAWHLVHVCAKLAVPDSVSAVERARLLGLVDAADGAANDSGRQALMP